MYISPLLEYSSAVWSPHLISDIRKLESVQKLFSKRLIYLESTSYMQRLALLKLPTLEIRRLHNDIIMCYKLINKLVAGTLGNHGLSLTSHCYTLRGNSLKLSTNPTKINACKFMFANRIAPVWNSLDDNTINVTTLKGFKRKLKTCNLTKFLLFK